jgi:uncharacterized repeat protein (TIGR04076 family)
VRGASSFLPLSYYPNFYHENNQAITDVELTVKVSVVEGKCQGDHHKIGDSWTIESVTPQGMCLGAWGAVYPYVMALDLDGGFSWEEDPSKIKISCPDPIGIKLLVEKIDEE